MQLDNAIKVSTLCILSPSENIQIYCSAWERNRFQSILPLKPLLVKLSSLYVNLLLLVELHLLILKQTVFLNICYTNATFQGHPQYP